MAQPEMPAPADEQPELDAAKLAELLADDEPEVPHTPADPAAAERANRLAAALVRSSHDAASRRLYY